MSIEYFVEGKIKTQVKGGYSAFSKENIIHNTIASVEQKGNKEGIKYNEAKKMNPNDKPTNLIDVSLNLFFDGTQNNKTNTTLGKNYEESNHEDDSYTNDFSNVARGYDAIDPNAENQIRVYIEGIGTTDMESDTILPGVGLGTGDTGVPAKVTKGCVKGAEALKSYAGKNIHLKVNVYGFSRGATAARHFVHIATNPCLVLKSSEKKGMALPPHEAEGKRIEVDQDDELITKHGYFGGCLRYWEVIPQKITFNFVGLYDTVASYGVDHRGKEVFGVPVIDNDTKQLGLDDVSKAYFVLQIAADDEFRDNFDLTNIKKSGVKGLEFTLPGVHSDIGGCYVNGSKESVDLFTEEGSTEKCERYRKILIEEGWYLPDEIFTRRTSPHVHGVDAIHILTGIREKLYNTYDKVAINSMFHYSKQFGVKYDEKSLKSHTIQDVFLMKVYNQLLGYMNACNQLRSGYVEEYNKTNSSGDYVEKLKTLQYEDFIDPNDLKTLRNQYLHWSASVTKFGLGPRVGKVANGKERKRNIQDG
ncbi:MULTISPECIES: phospholipase effector Tle1 domain-containing protein [unclassified Chryseobacterium]|uniref:phospholipase effector Tle1 domain-containing protein n=1 Tax=unclassified Chryseobacterium TaxID=2593645 RepID=UPI003017C110